MEHPSFFRILAVFSVLISVLGMVSCENQSGTASGSKANSPPSIKGVRIFPEKPVRGYDLSLSIEAQDPNGDTITYEYQWNRNEQEIPRGTHSILDHNTFKKGDLIRVKVTPNDGKARGAPFLSSPVKVLNSLPVIQEVRIEPRVPVVSDSLKVFCRSDDKDGDFVYFTYQWETNGVVLTEERGEVLDRGRFKKGDSITVTVTPDDREVLGVPKRSDPVIISNSLSVIISSSPSRLEGNLYSYQVKANDPDNDPITFTLVAGPKGMKIDKSSGLIQWEVRKGDKGVFPVEIEASDPDGAKSIQTYTLTLEVR